MLLNAPCVCPRVSRYQSNCLFLHHTVRATSCQGQNRTNTHLTMRLSAYLYWRFGSSSSHQTLTQTWHPLWPVTPSLHAAGAFHTLLAPRQLTTLWKSVRLCVRVCVCLTLQLHGHQSRQPTRWKHGEFPKQKQREWDASSSEYKIPALPLLFHSLPSSHWLLSFFPPMPRLLHQGQPDHTVLWCSFKLHFVCRSLPQTLSESVYVCVCVHAHSFRSYLA